MGVIIDIADGIVAALNAEPWLGAEAKRHYRPEFDLTELGELRVSVVPRGIVLESASRSVMQMDVSIDVAVQKRASETAELDALMSLVERVAGLLRGKRFSLSGGASAAWVKTENQPIYSPEHLQQKQVFTSVLTVTFRVIR